MSVSRKELEKMVIKCQIGELEFDELFKSAEKLIHNCYWRIYDKRQAYSVEILELDEIKSIAYEMFFHSVNEFDISKGFAFSTLFYNKTHFAILNAHRRALRIGEGNVFSLDNLVKDRAEGHEFIGEDGFEESKVRDLLQIVESVLEKCGYDEKLKQSLMTHILTGEALSKVAERNGIYQVKASRAIIKFREKNEN